MQRFSSYIPAAFSEEQNIDVGELRKALRIGHVRAIWADLVEDIFLQHTNGVYIFKEAEKTIMRVYVDESIYAAELNNRRELIMLLCRERYGEVVDEFQIIISRGIMKKRHPFIDDKPFMPDQKPPVALSLGEYEEVNKQCAAIEDEALREKFKKAMIADLEWKKGNPQ